MLGDFVSNLLLWCTLLLFAGWVQGVVGGFFRAHRSEAGPGGAARSVLGANSARSPQICSPCGSSGVWMVASEHGRWS
jgi:hypothetical protein